MTEGVVSAGTRGIYSLSEGLSVNVPTNKTHVFCVNGIVQQTFNVNGVQFNTGVGTVNRKQQVKTLLRPLTRRPDLLSFGALVGAAASQGTSLQAVLLAACLFVLGYVPEAKKSSSLFEKPKERPKKR